MMRGKLSLLTKKYMLVGRTATRNPGIDPSDQNLLICSVNPVSLG